MEQNRYPEGVGAGMVSAAASLEVPWCENLAGLSPQLWDYLSIPVVPNPKVIEPGGPQV